jgi:hypothetical protein
MDHKRIVSVNAGRFAAHPGLADFAIIVFAEGLLIQAAEIVEAFDALTLPPVGEAEIKACARVHVDWSSLIPPVGDIATCVHATRRNENQPTDSNPSVKR